MYTVFFTNCLLSLFLVLSILLINPKITSAACSVTISYVDSDGNTIKDTLPSDFNGDVTITPVDNPGENCLFPEAYNYTVGFYPATKEPGGSQASTLRYFLATDALGSQTIPSFTTFPSESRQTGKGIDCGVMISSGGNTAPHCRKLSGKLDITQDPIGASSSPTGRRYANQTWNIVVCTSISIDYVLCQPGRANSTYYTSGTFKVGTRVALPAPPDLPEIDLTNQKCIFQSGAEDIEIKVKNILPPLPGNAFRAYFWWWADEFIVKQHRFLENTNNTITTATFTIPKVKDPECISGNNSTDCTVNLSGFKTLCVDIHGEKRHEKDQKNCVILKFQKTSLIEGTDRSCNPDTQAPISTDVCKNIKATCAKEGKICLNGRCVKESLSSPSYCDPTKPNSGISTALGCIHSTPSELIRNIFTFFVGVSGGIAFLTMVYGGFKMMVSRGDPQALANAKQLFTSAIIGLLFVVFAILLLQIIGADILAIPGFKS